jgi:hypothetical protein
LMIRDVEAQVKKRNGVQLVFVALLSALFTVMTLYMLDLTKLPEMESALKQLRS